MENFYNANPAFFGASAFEGTMAKGYFVGENDKGEVEIAGQTISYQPFGISHFANEPIEIARGTPAGGTLINGGHAEILQEFYGSGSTERAKKIIAQLSATRTSLANAWARRTSAYVAAVRDWSGDSGIGGEIAVVVLEQGKRWRWFHRPDFCPKN